MMHGIGVGAETPASQLGLLREQGHIYEIPKHHKQRSTMNMEAAFVHDSRLGLPAPWEMHRWKTCHLGSYYHSGSGRPGSSASLRSQQSNRSERSSVLSVRSRSQADVRAAPSSRRQQGRSHMPQAGAIAVSNVPGMAGRPTSGCHF
eukprot:TRINITY_DN44463_c0_g1_i1.p1 TRINITY_DN44463_c0_g1~~TRINITY_DN44463_c0_g1_i1.p1  ORF type:complete len:147 (+),score=18.03 TRINITY_DN44463_c0_g1_i1:58-498(+)